MVTVWTYLGSAGLGLILVVAGLMLGFGDADMDGDGDMDTDGAHGSLGAGVSLLSMAGMGSVLFGFGVTGYAVHGLVASHLVAVPAGLAGAYGCLRLTGWVKGLLVRNLDTGSSAGEQDLLYQPATVTVPIPPDGLGRGQVVVRKGDRTFYVAARSTLTRELITGEQVVITDTRDGAYLVDLYRG